MLAKPVPSVKLNPLVFKLVIPTTLALFALADPLTPNVWDPMPVAT